MCGSRTRAKGHGIAGLVLVRTGGRNALSGFGLGDGLAVAFELARSSWSQDEPLHDMGNMDFK